MVGRSGAMAKRDAHYPAIGTNHRRAGVTISQLGRQHEHSPLGTAVAIQVLADGGDLLGDGGGLNGEGVLAVRVAEDGTFFAYCPGGNR